MQKFTTWYRLFSGRHVLIQSDYFLNYGKYLKICICILQKTLYLICLSKIFDSVKKKGFSWAIKIWPRFLVPSFSARSRRMQLPAKELLPLKYSLRKRTNNMADKEPGSDATREEKLNFINEKLTLLHWQAKESKNIRSLKFASNLFSEYGRSNKKHRYISMFTKFSVLIGLFSCFIYCDPLYRYALASSRKLTIKVSKATSLYTEFIPSQSGKLTFRQI